MRGRFGVEPICVALQVAVVSVRCSIRRGVSARRVEDDGLQELVRVVFDANYQVYGARKVRKALLREYGLVVDRGRVSRLMQEIGIFGVVRGRKVFTTHADAAAVRAPDLVKRDFTAGRPNKLWVCDFTYVPTWSGMVYVAFIIDVSSRVIVGGRVSTTMTAELVTDALDAAIFLRRTLLDRVIAHSDAGSQYTSLRYTEALAEIGARPSIGTVADSYDNAMAESTIGLYKTELTKRRGPWRNAEHLEIETLLYIKWFNNRRLHSEIGDIPPAEHEQDWYNRHRPEPTVPVTTGT